MRFRRLALPRNGGWISICFPRGCQYYTKALMHLSSSPMENAVEAASRSSQTQDLNRWTSETAVHLQAVCIKTTQPSHKGPQKVCASNACLVLNSSNCLQISSRFIRLLVEIHGHTRCIRRLIVCVPRAYEPNWYCRRVHSCSSISKKACNAISQ